MFDLNKKGCTLAHINLRDEKHGDDNVLAVDLKFQGDFTGDILAEFGADLRDCLFKMAEGGDLADQASDTPTQLRFPQMIQPLKFDAEITGAKVTIEYGLGDLVLPICNVNNFKVECHDGGTVRVTFRVQAKPTGEQLAKISSLLASSATISIESPRAANDDQQALQEAA